MKKKKQKEKNEDVFKPIYTFSITYFRIEQQSFFFFWCVKHLTPYQSNYFLSLFLFSFHLLLLLRSTLSCLLLLCEQSLATTKCAVCSYGRTLTFQVNSARTHSTYIQYTNKIRKWKKKKVENGISFVQRQAPPHFHSMPVQRKRSVHTI